MLCLNSSGTKKKKKKIRPTLHNAQLHTLCHNLRVKTYTCFKKSDCLLNADFQSVFESKSLEVTVASISIRNAAKYCSKYFGTVFKLMLNEMRIQIEMYVLLFLQITLLRGVLRAVL